MSVQGFSGQFLMILMDVCVNVRMNVWTRSAFLSAVVFFTMACAADDGERSGLNSLEPFEWENRVLIVFTDEGNHQRLANQLHRDKLLVDDRDMLWFVVDGNRVETNYAGRLDGSFAQTMVQQFQTGVNGPLEVVLIGKDGGVKYRANRLEADEIYFEIIDVMPMRRNEMRGDD